jgi:hypothetical protein
MDKEYLQKQMDFLEKYEDTEVRQAAYNLGCEISRIIAEGKKCLKCLAVAPVICEKCMDEMGKKAYENGKKEAEEA